MRPGSKTISRCPQQTECLVGCHQHAPKTIMQLVQPRYWGTKSYLRHLDKCIRSGTMQHILRTVHCPTNIYKGDTQ